MNIQCSYVFKLNDHKLKQAKLFISPNFENFNSFNTISTKKSNRKDDLKKTTYYYNSKKYLVTLHESESKEKVLLYFSNEKI